MKTVLLSLCRALWHIFRAKMENLARLKKSHSNVRIKQLHDVSSQLKSGALTMFAPFSCSVGERIQDAIFESPYNA